MTNDTLQQELRQVFRDELEDQLTSIEEQRKLLADQDATGDEKAAAARELYRAVHSLKGASRAAGYPEIEKTCHALEDELSVLRGGGTLSESRSLSLAEQALEGLGSWLERVNRDVSPASQKPAVESSHPPVAAERSVSSVPVSQLSESSAPSALATTRVPSWRLNELSVAAEELAVRAQHFSSPSAAAVSDALHTLERAIRAMEPKRWGSGEAAEGDHETLLMRASGSVKTLRILLQELENSYHSHAGALHRAAHSVVARAQALRLVELSQLGMPIERACSEAAAALKKDVQLECNLFGVELDRRVADALREPLMHLVRNAVDHGVESPEERQRLGKPRAASLRVSARASGREVAVSVEDDGRGIDPSRLLRSASEAGITRATPTLELAFQPGVSSRDSASSLSGRGMGLNIVRERIAALHGRVEVRSQVGHGTTFSLFVPYDLGMLRALVVEVGDELCAIVTTSVARLARPTADEIKVHEGRTYYCEDGGLVPLLSLGSLLGWPTREQATVYPCVVLAAGERRAAFQVDGLREERDILIKPFGSRIQHIPFGAGVTAVDADRLALVLDSAQLLRAARPGVQSVSAAARNEPGAHQVLLVDDSVTTRQLLKTVLNASGYRVTVAQDGAVAWQLLQEREFDLIVTDIEMPHVDGFQLLARIRRTPRLSRMPVVIVTALARDSDRQRADDLSADAYVVKRDFDQGSLLRTIEELL